MILNLCATKFSVINEKETCMFNKIRGGKILLCPKINKRNLIY